MKFILSLNVETDEKAWKREWDSLNALAEIFKDRGAEHVAVTSVVLDLDVIEEHKDYKQSVDLDQAVPRRFGESSE